MKPSKTAICQASTYNCEKALVLQRASRIFPIKLREKFVDVADIACPDVILPEDENFQKHEALTPTRVSLRVMHHGAGFAVLGGKKKHAIFGHSFDYLHYVVRPVALLAQGTGRLKLPLVDAQNIFSCPSSQQGCMQRGCRRSRKWPCRL